MLVPVTTPRCCHRTADCAAISVGAAVKPMPRPITNDVAPTWRTLEDPSSRSSSAAAEDDDDGADERGRPDADPEVDPAGLRRRDRPAEREGGQREPGDQRPGAQDVLHERRHVRGQPEQHGADAGRDEVGGDEQPVPQQPERDDRIGRPPLDEHEHPEQDGAAGQDGDALRRPPRPGLAALEQAEDEQRQRDGEHHRAGVVDLRTAPVDPLVEPQADRRRGDQAQRDVDEEDPPPVDVLREDPAERRAHDRRHRPDAGDVALHLRPFLERVEVTDDRHRHRLDRAGAEPLHGAERDERAHARGESAEDRADEEQADADEHHRLAPEDVGELAVDRARSPPARAGRPRRATGTRRSRRGSRRSTGRRSR